MPALLSGFVTPIADTSELRRRAFNDAFRLHHLDWTWSRSVYRSMPATSGGERRIAAYARSISQEVDAHDVYRTTVSLFRARLAESRRPQPGVVETITDATANGFKVGIVITSAPDCLSSLIAAVADHIRLRDFALVADTALTAQRPSGSR